jgi:hypothetical protein
LRGYRPVSALVAEAMPWPTTTDRESIIRFVLLAQADRSTPPDLCEQFRRSDGRADGVIT